jgi:hypothetical protein
MRLWWLLTGLLLSGCPKLAPVPPPAVLSPERLREAFPTLTTPFVAREFRARPGLVNKHVHKAGKLVGTLLIEDLRDSPEQRALFEKAPLQVQRCPAISTSMGGGIALLYQNRFKVEAVALDPAVSEGTCRRWLEGFRLSALKEAP